MSTDRELLELAAKAAGYEIEWVRNSGCHYRCEEEIGREQWCPLDDDGDALRLAAALRLQILPGKHHRDGCSVNPTHHNTPGVTSFVESKDMAEQMRRAITWAAAEIGRAMP
ncbi:hypothetical protein [Pseudomonas sp. JUb52]|uniref:hypothetical protein n=1 Tax=Pseudomonas sp. JUb52 TaxID=2485127 RepID=UPI00104FBB7D|nr:hypothetical protein [Pseudomonas sp. JUb52]TCQ94072.1 hypothetical protein EC839_101193 [Pseudomonas sp. JUb52]